MTLFGDPLTYLFYPNPANAGYSSPKAMILLCVCGLMVLGSFAIRYWRAKQTNPVTKKLSRSWSSTMFWLGLTGLLLVVARVETISYLSMRFLWAIWLLGILGYAFLQFKIFRAKHYEIVPKEKKEQDPMEKYLPQKKK